MRYVRFAAGPPAHFQVMFRPELHRADDPDLLTAKARAARSPRAGAEEITAGDRGDDTRLAGVAARSPAHGFATVLLSGDPEDPVGGRGPEEVFRAVTGMLLTGIG